MPHVMSLVQHGCVCMYSALRCGAGRDWGRTGSGPKTCHLLFNNWFGVFSLSKFPHKAGKVYLHQATVCECGQTQVPSNPSTFVICQFHAPSMTVCVRCM